MWPCKHLVGSTSLSGITVGRLEEGYYADIVVFDPQTVADRATCEMPHRYSVGVRDVIVNGRAVLRDGEHTGAFPGRALYGPGKV